MPSAIPQIASNYAARTPKGFNRKVYAQQLLPNFWEANYVTRVTQNTWGGSDLLSRKGNRLVFTRTPTPQILDYVEGQPIVIQRWQPETIEYVPKRMDYFATADTPVSRFFSPYGEKSVMMSQSDMAKMAKLQREFLEFAISVSARNPENVGAAVGNADDVQAGYAGKKDRSYLIGSYLRPVYVGASYAEIQDLTSYTCPKAVAYDMLINGMAMIDEQSMSGQLAAFNSYAIMSRSFAARAQLAFARQAQATQDKKSSWFFADARVLMDGKNTPAGFDDLFMDNMLPSYTVPSGAGTGNAPAGTTAIPVVVGLSNAISYDQGFSDMQGNLLSQQNFDSVDKKMWLYDYFSLFDKFVVTMWITTKPYNLNT